MIGSLTGTTTAGYTTALEWTDPYERHKTMLLKNTDATLSLKYKVLGYAIRAGISKELIAETTLLADEIAEFHWQKQWHELIIQVIDGSGHATYQIDYEGR